MKELMTIVSFEPLTDKGPLAIGKLTARFAEFMHSEGHPVVYYCINKRSYKTNFSSFAVHWSARYFLQIFVDRRKIRLIPKLSTRRLEEQYFDFFLALLPLSGDCLLTTTPFIPRSLRKFREKFRTIVYLPPTPNEAILYQICSSEINELARNRKCREGYTDPKRLRTFLKGISFLRRIVCYSPVTAATYKFSHIVTEIPFIYVPDDAVGSLKINTARKKVSFLYIAYSSVLKGLHRLLIEWESPPSASSRNSKSLDQSQTITISLSASRLTTMLG